MVVALQLLPQEALPLVSAQHLVSLLVALLWRPAKRLRLAEHRTRWLHLDPRSSSMAPRSKLRLCRPVLGECSRLGAMTSTEDASCNVVVPGRTARPGQQTVVGGITCSLASSGSVLVLNGATQTLQSASAPIRSAAATAGGPAQQTALSGGTLDERRFLSGHLAIAGVLLLALPSP